MLLIISTNKSIHINSLIPLCEKLTSVSGRLEYIGQYNQGLIYVDYAHTPNALEEVLVNLREHCNNKLKVVFGCGGNRDVSKRKIMGKIASKLAEEPELTIRPNLLPKSFATFFSKSFTDGPSISVRFFLVKTSLTALISFRS